MELKKIKIGIAEELKNFTLEELKQLEEEEIKKYAIKLVLTIQDIKNNEDLFLEYIVKKGIAIYCKDYESALLVNELVNKGIIKPYEIYLMDDQEQKDRSYIDATVFKNVTLRVPNTYAMWGVKFDDKLWVYQYQLQNDLTNETEFSGYYDHETLKEVERIALMISEFPEVLTDVEKIILVSNYLQKYCQFIEGKESHVGNDIYVLDDVQDENSVNPKNVTQIVLGDSKTALFNNFGVCRTFADATTLLLNNPYLRIKTRNVRSEYPHVWNVVELNGKTYQLDNSRAISRGKYRLPDALKTAGFDYEYVLYGQAYSDEIGHEKMNDRTYLSLPLSIESFDRRYIEAAVEHLKDTDMVNFNYGDKVFYRSHKK